MQCYLTEISNITNKVATVARNIMNKTDCKDIMQKQFIFVVEDFHNIDCAHFTNKVIFLLKFVFLIIHHR